MVRFLGYCGPTVYEILHLPRLSKATLDFFFFFKKTKRKPEGETLALSRVAIESYLTVPVTSLDSSGSSGRVPRVLEWVCVSLWRGGQFSHRVHQVQDKSTATAGGRHPTKHPARYSRGFTPRVCVCCFVLLNWYWGIVTVRGFLRVNRP